MRATKPHEDERHASLNVTIEVLLDRDAEQRALRDLRDGLLQTPRSTSPRFFYDDVGSRLFEQITELPTYYQTRTEAAILQEIAPTVVARTGARELVELGSGASAKTRVLLDAMAASDQLRHYVPFDVSEGIVRRAAEELVREYDGLQIHGIIGEFAGHLDAIPRSDRRLLIFLGGTIGNFTDNDARAFLGGVAAVMTDDEYLLLGMDLIKDHDILRNAYDDPDGITAAFNRNMLSVLNRTAHADFQPREFGHRAVYNSAEHRIEMWLDARSRQTAHIRRLDMTLFFEPGDAIRSEISLKYNRASAEALLRDADMQLVEWYQDADARFALVLARRAAKAAA
jgi:L-histidine N-alpha-methyltransferase